MESCINYGEGFSNFIHLWSFVLKDSASSEAAANVLLSQSSCFPAISFRALLEEGGGGGFEGMSAIFLSSNFSVLCLCKIFATFSLCSFTFGSLCRNYFLYFYYAEFFLVIASPSLALSPSRFLLARPLFSPTPKLPRPWNRLACSTFHCDGHCWNAGHYD